MKIQDQVRAQHVLRWTIVPTVGRQTVADHSFTVALIAREITRRINHEEPTLAVDWGINRPQDIDRITVVAMFHDIKEVITGDIPSPTKRRIGKDFEDGIVPPATACPRRHLEYVIVKAADHIENLLWFKSYRPARSTYADQVYQDVLASCNKFLNFHDTDAVVWHRDLTGNAPMGSKFVAIVRGVMQDLENGKVTI